MASAASARDDHFEPALTGVRGVLEEQVGCAVRGDNANLVGHSDRFQSFDRVSHRLPVGAGAHDHADERRRSG